MTVGRTKEAGFQIGVSRTVPYQVGEVWRLLTSAHGLALWLGEPVRWKAEKGAEYRTAAGVTGEVRSFRELDRVRLTWQPDGWDHATTVQVAVAERPNGTLLRSHQERLADSAERERQRRHWRAVLDDVVSALDSDRTRQGRSTVDK